MIVSELGQVGGIPGLVDHHRPVELLDRAGEMTPPELDPYLELPADFSGDARVLAEQIVLSEEGLVRIPPHLSFEEAATLPCAAVTAWNAVFVRGALCPGQTLVALGTGGVSLFAAQFGLMTGALNAVMASTLSAIRVSTPAATSPAAGTDSPDRDATLTAVRTCAWPKAGTLKAVFASTSSAVRAFDEPRPYEISRALMTTDWPSVVNDPAVQLVVELVGGTTLAKTMADAGPGGLGGVAVCVSTGRM